MRRDYGCPVYKRCRAIVLKRDKCCQLCGSKKRLQVHHISPWSVNTHQRYDPNNCVALCYYCHKKVTGHEHLYIPLFQSKVNNSSRKK